MTPSGRRSPTGSAARSDWQPFRYYLRVRYIECDAQKVVFNSRYSEYVDDSINELLRAMGVLKDCTDGDLDFQLLKQTVEWKATDHAACGPRPGADCDARRA